MAWNTNNSKYKTKVVHILFGNKQNEREKEKEHKKRKHSTYFQASAMNLHKYYLTHDSSSSNSRN